MRLRILHLEDDRLDGELVRETLAAGGLDFDIERVQTGEAFERAFHGGRFDLVLSDYTLPSYSGATALAYVRGLRPEVPFILVSGTLGEEAAIDSLLAGATDYVLKAKLHRLVPAVQRAVREAEERRARKEAEEAVRASEQRYRRLFEAAAFLSKASALVSESLDYEKTLSRLGSLCVESLADWCVLDLVEGRELRRIAGACADPAKGPLLELLRLRHPARWDSRHPASQCLRSGEALLFPELTDEMHRQHVDDEEHFELVRALQTRSAVIVPLVARGQTLGVLTLASGTPGRYGSADLELAREVARRAAIAIDNARLHRETQRALRLRDEFLMMASHELRTPMTPLTMSLRMLQRWERSSALPPAISESVKLAARQGTRLNSLIDELLDGSRIESGQPRLDLSQADLGDIVRAAAARLQPELARARCPLSIRCGAPVRGRWDASRLDQVVTNLLSNAIKFGAGEPIEIRLDQDGGRALLSVRDHGIGVHAAHQARIFERFERAVSIKHYGGLGLGLYISRRIVEAHGGTIKVESAPGQGSTFIVELPCAEP